MKVRHFLTNFHKRGCLLTATHPVLKSGTNEMKDSLAIEWLFCCRAGRLKKWKEWGSEGNGGSGDCGGTLIFKMIIMIRIRKSWPQMGKRTKYVARMEKERGENGKENVGEVEDV